MVAYTYNFYDGHVSISIKGNDPWQRCHELLAGNDYGLSLLRLSDGKTIAVNVEENSEAWNNGIRNQTIITGWNNQKIDEAIEETEFIYIGATMPVKATEDLFKPIMLATKGYRENGRKGIGLTPSNCSCQEVGGRSVLSNSICQINYPINWLYEIDETTRYIDTGKSRKYTVPLDYQIPLTYELAQSLYDNWQTRDILLEYAIDYLK